MSTLHKRLSEFNSDTKPPAELRVELLCRDKNGTYVLPYDCCWSDDQWRNFETDEAVVASIVGWRSAEQRRRYRPLRKK